MDLSVRSGAVVRWLELRELEVLGKRGDPWPDHLRMEWRIRK